MRVGTQVPQASSTGWALASESNNEQTYSDRNCNIKFKEGILNIQFDENENIYMTGPVSEIKNIEVNI